MDSKIEIKSSGTGLLKATELFFKTRTFGETKDTFFKLFQCWGIKECYKRIDLTNAEVALFYDQLLNLVGQAYITFHADKPALDGEEGEYVE